MSNERTDEFLSWRGRLDQPDALPEQGLDNHEASWQRLAERLHEKPRRRLTGYWVAAACLLLALIPAIRFFYHRPAPEALRYSKPQRSLAEKIATGPRPGAATPPVAKAQAKAATHSIAAAPLPSAPLSAAPLPAAGHEETPITITAPAILPAACSPRLMAQAPAPGKPLRIVYFNEINHPATSSHNMASRDPGFLRISMGSAAGISSSYTDLPQNNAAGITINLTTQNH